MNPNLTFCKTTHLLYGWLGIERTSAAGDWSASLPRFRPTKDCRCGLSLCCLVKVWTGVYVAHTFLGVFFQCHLPFGGRNLQSRTRIGHSTRRWGRIPSKCRLLSRMMPVAVGLNNEHFSWQTVVASTNLSIAIHMVVVVRTVVMVRVVRGAASSNGIINDIHDTITIRKLGK